MHLNNASDQTHFLKVMPSLLLLLRVIVSFKWGDPSGVICSPDCMMLFLSCFSILLHSFITYVFITQWSPTLGTLIFGSLSVHCTLSFNCFCLSVPFYHFCIFAADGLFCVLLTLDYICQLNLCLWFDVSRTLITPFYLYTFALLYNILPLPSPLTVTSSHYSDFSQWRIAASTVYLNSSLWL